MDRVLLESDLALPALRARMDHFNHAMLANSIDARYGLVTFRGTEALQQDFVDYAAFTSPESPFSQLSHLEGGGAHPELGSDAILLGLNQTSFRSDSVINFILFIRNAPALHLPDRVRRFESQFS